MRRYRHAGSLFLLAALAVCGLSTAAPQPAVVVFAATSLTDVLREIASAYTQQTQQPVTLSFAGSSALAQQIASGSAADVFLPADSESMDYVENRKGIDPASRRDLLRNQLVLIAPAAATTNLKIAPRFELEAALGEGRLAMADPQAVAAGRYAHYALISLGVWNAVSDHIVMANSVPATLASVARGEAVMGIVYETDARASKAVRIVDTFPRDSYPWVVYPVALTSKAKAGAERFVDFLSGPEGRRIFAKHGFEAAKNQ